MPKPKVEELPKDWQPTQAVPEPIINNPYDEPTKHWLYRDGAPYEQPGRRPASYWFKTKRLGRQERGLLDEIELTLRQPQRGGERVPHRRRVGRFVGPVRLLAQHHRDLVGGTESQCKMRAEPQPLKKRTLVRRVRPRSRAHVG